MDPLETHCRWGEDPQEKRAPDGREGLTYWKPTGEGELDLLETHWRGGAGPTGNPLERGSWTLTNLIHNLCMYLLLHTVKGTPFETPDQGKARLLTHWEQMDYGLQFTASRKFLTITPIILYILTSFYTKYDRAHFVVNTVSLLVVLIPKLPQLHGVRIFGINKY